MESFVHQYDVSVQRYTVKPQKDAGRAMFIWLNMPEVFSSTVLSTAHDNSKLYLSCGNGDDIPVEAGNITCKLDKGENIMQVSINMAILASYTLNPEELASRAKYLKADGTPAQPTLGESAALLPEDIDVTVYRNGVADPEMTESFRRDMAAGLPPLEGAEDAPELPEGAKAGLIELRVKQLLEGLTKGQDADDGSWDELNAKLSEQTLETLDGLHAHLEAGTLTAERVLAASDLSEMALSTAQVREGRKPKGKKPSTSSAAQMSA